MPFNSERIQTYFFIGLLGVFGGATLLMALPYVYYLLGATVLAYLAYPLYSRVAKELRSERAAALLMMTFLIVMAVLPMILLADLIVNQAQRMLLSLGSQTLALINTAQVEQQILEMTGQSVDLQQMIRTTLVEAGQFFSNKLPGLVSTALDALIGILVMSVTMYYLFREGDQVVDRIKRMMPIEPQYADRLAEETEKVTRAILIGHVLTSVIQGLIVGTGMYVVGMDGVLFWTFIVTLLSMVPPGNILVWFPAGLYLVFIQSQVLAGAAFLIYCFLGLSVSDQLLRIQFISYQAKIHPLFIMLGVIGGIPLFGLLGVVLGPLTIGVFLTLLRVYRDEVRDGKN